MRTFLILALLAAVVAGTFAYKENLLKHNKTPKNALATAEFSSVCDECQTMVKRFADVAKDRTKMAELKALLGLMCQECPYKDECHLMVANLDKIIDRLLPYMKDPHAVCQRLHMCENSKLDQFHRVALIYAKKYLSQVEGAHDLICEECEFAAHELQEVVDDHDTQVQIRQFISQNICAHMGPYRGSCDIVVDDFLPDLFQELHNLLANGKQFCADLKLCPAQQRRGSDFAVDQKDRIYGPVRVKNMFYKLTTLKTKQEPHVYMSCLECRIAIDALLIELKTNSSYYKLGYDLRDGVCPKLPTAMLAGCTDFLTMYAPTVVFMTLEQMDSESVCEKLKVCDAQSFAQIAKMSASELTDAKCETCKGLTEFVRMEIGAPAFKDQLVYGFGYYACERLPGNLVNVCESLAKSYIPLALEKLQAKLQDETVCHDKLHLC